MAETSYMCSIAQGFNFQKDAQTLVGHINSLSISQEAIPSDLTITDPLEIANTIKVFGIVSNIYWEGGYGDPIQFSCQVGTKNKNMLAALQHKKLKDTTLELEFTIYDYDPEAKKYFKCFHTNGEKLTGLIYKSGGSLAMNIEMEESTEVVSPKNFPFTLGIMPAEKDMAVHVAISDEGKFVKKWGIEVAA